MDIKIVVIGAGEVGYNVVKALSKDKFDITVIDINEVKSLLITNIPSYMIPAKFIKLDKMPLNQNGKIERKQLKCLHWLRNKTI